MRVKNSEVVARTVNLLILLHFLPEQKVREAKKALIEAHRILEERLVSDACEKKMMTKREYAKRFRNKYVDKSGVDNFLLLLGLALAGAGKVATYDEKILEDKDLLERKFGVKIVGLTGFSEVRGDDRLVPDYIK